MVSPLRRKTGWRGCPCRDRKRVWGERGGMISYVAHVAQFGAAWLDYLDRAFSCLGPPPEPIMNGYGCRKPSSTLP
jgi:hypothetical protein